MGLKKAKIKIQKEYISEEVECTFNPAEYAITNTANYNEGKSSPQHTLSFSSVSLRELKVTLYFSSDNTNNLLSLLTELPFAYLEPVTDITQKIVKALYVSGTEHRPPLVSFVWGNLDFEGFLTSVSETYTMFDSSGKPIRGKLDISIKEAGEMVLSRKKEPFESPDRTKWKTMTEGMSYWDLAYQEYGDPGKWRIIADANGIVNPLEVVNGQIIKIPAL